MRHLIPLTLLLGLGPSLGSAPLQAPVTHGGASSAKHVSVPIQLSYRSAILYLEVGEAGIPCDVEVGGELLDEDGSPAGSFLAGFFGCPTLEQLPEALSDNPFGIPAGTELPAWEGDVVYLVHGEGMIVARERAFIFPSDPEDPASPLVVLSTSTLSHGSGAFKNAKGELITPDGFDDVGSVVGTLSVK